jgi:hypothetical protein
VVATAAAARRAPWRRRQVCDILISVNGVEARSLEAVRSLLLGDKGTRVILELCRPASGPDGRLEYGRLRVSLVRGDARFFLTLDTERCRQEAQVRWNAWHKACWSVGGA